MSSAVPPPGIHPADGQPAAGGEVRSADRAAFVVTAILVGVAAGFAGGFVWAAVANPPEATVTRRGVFLASEVAYNAQVSASLWFLVVGVVGGVVLGLGAGLVGRKHGLATIAAAVLMCAAASGIAAWSGASVFGPDLDEQVAGAKPGDQVTTELSVGADVVYLGWPIGGLLGVFGAIACWPADRKQPPADPMSSTVVGHSS